VTWTKAQEAELELEREKGRRFELGRQDAIRQSGAGSAAERLASIREQIKARPIHRTTRRPCRSRATGASFDVEIQNGAVCRLVNHRPDLSRLRGWAETKFASWAPGQRPEVPEFTDETQAFRFLDQHGVGHDGRAWWYPAGILPDLQMCSQHLEGPRKDQMKTWDEVSYLLEPLGPEVIVHEGPASASAA
jgi:hypothetical protein